MLDSGFTKFVANTLVSFIWIVIVVLTFLGYFGFVVYAITQDMPLAFPLSFVVVPLVASLFLLLVRIGLEGIIVLFRIETHLRSIREHYEKE